MKKDLTDEILQYIRILYIYGNRRSFHGGMIVDTMEEYGIVTTKYQSKQFRTVMLTEEGKAYAMLMNKL